LQNDEGTDNKKNTVNFITDEDGYLRFMTDDPANAGYSFGKILDTKIYPMTTVKTQIKKISGSKEAGFGIFFCCQNSDNFYLLEINLKGKYCLWKKYEGNWTRIFDWTIPVRSSINQNYSDTNELRIDYDKDLKMFYVFFNGVKETSFYDDMFQGGYFGYYAEVGSDESFSANYPDIRFKQIDPFNVQ
jgi:hypothetical protein